MNTNSTITGTHQHLLGCDDIKGDIQFWVVVANPTMACVAWRFFHLALAVRSIAKEMDIVPGCVRLWVLMPEGCSSSENLHEHQQHEPNKRHDCGGVKP